VGGLLHTETENAVRLFTDPDYMDFALFISSGFAGQGMTVFVPDRAVRMPDAMMSVSRDHLSMRAAGEQKDCS
jgi:hypothetical protein